MLTLSMMKKQCRIDPDFTDEDDLLTQFSDAAVRYIENQTDRTMYEFEVDIPEEDDAPMLLDASLRMAMLMLVAHWYENREAVIVGSISSAIPLAVESLIQPYRIYGV